MTAIPKPSKLRDGTEVWRVQFRLKPGGPPTREVFDTFEEALKFSTLVDRIGGIAARQVRNQTDQSALGDPTIRALFDKYLADIDGTVTQGTVDGYRREAEQSWLPALGDIPVSALTTDAVHKWMVAEGRKTSRNRLPNGQHKRIATKTVKNRHAVLSQMLDWANTRGIVRGNVAKGMKPLDDVERAGKVYVTPDQFTAIIEHVPDYWKPLIAVLYGTGVRWGEATALRVKDLHLDEDDPWLMVERAWKHGAGADTYIGTPKSRAGTRRIGLAATLVDILRAQANGKGLEDYLFTRPDGTQIIEQRFRRSVWLPAVESANIGVRPRIHDLRHGRISNLIRGGVPVNVIQYEAGHESIKTTVDTYASVAPDGGRIAASVADASLSGAFPQIEAAATSRALSQALPSLPS